MVLLPHEHHGGHRHFDPERFLAMEEMRRQIMPPEEVLGDFLSRDDATLADIGVGPGFFALPAARLLRRGKVYAIDRQDDMLDLVRTRSESEGLDNIVTVHADASSVPIANHSVDAVLMANVFHDLDNRSVMLAEVSRILRPGCPFYLVEWDKVATEMGPPLEMRIAPPDLEAEVASGGFLIDRRFEGPFPFYRLLTRRP
jgi:SAM-dependent methyltransferase